MRENRRCLGLRDRARLTDRAVIVSVEALAILERFTGEMSLAHLAESLGIEATHLHPFVEELDRALLLEGPTFESFLDEKTAAFDAWPIMPIRAAHAFTPDRLGRALERAGDVAANPAAGRIRGLVVPHLDLDRGEANYAAGYAALRRQGPPDRVVVLGANHFGRATGVVMNDKPQRTPCGDLPGNTDLAGRLRAALGPRLTKHRLDHVGEHSVELQAPWVRHLWGPVPTVGFLLHDPLPYNGASYDGAGVDIGEFTDALNAAVNDLGGVTLFIASADLSHVGADFGDDLPNTAERLAAVERHDREHLTLLERNDCEGFLRSMAACGNATRWCTLGGLAALWQLLPSTRARLIRYRQSLDRSEGGRCCVTSAAIVLEDEALAEPMGVSRAGQS